MLVNASKTKALIISRSLTDRPRFPALALGGDVLSVVRELRILGVILDSKLTFERQIRSIAASAAQKLGILRKPWQVFQDVDVVKRCFWSFILPILEYCSPVWSFAADFHLALLDRVVSSA